MRHKRKNHDHAIAMAAKIVVGATGALMGILFLKSIPDLIRYVKITRM
jgi:Family of unknown function (DUF6893)